MAEYKSCDYSQSKMNQIVFQSKGRYLISDLFFSTWCRFSDRRSYLFQNRLNILREARDIFIYVLGGCLISSHIIPFLPPSLFG